MSWWKSLIRSPIGFPEVARDGDGLHNQGVIDKVCYRVLLTREDMDPLGDRPDNLEPLGKGLFPRREMRNKSTKHTITQAIDETFELAWYTHKV